VKKIKNAHTMTNLLRFSKVHKKSANPP